MQSWLRLATHHPCPPTHGTHSGTHVPRQLPTNPFIQPKRNTTGCTIHCANASGSDTGTRRDETRHKHDTSGAKIAAASCWAATRFRCRLKKPHVPQLQLPNVAPGAVCCMRRPVSCKPHRHTQGPQTGAKVPRKRYKTHNIIPTASDAQPLPSSSLAWLLAVAATPSRGCCCSC